MSMSSGITTEDIAKVEEYDKNCKHCLTSLIDKSMKDTIIEDLIKIDHLHIRLGKNAYKRKYTTERKEAMEQLVECQKILYSFNLQTEKGKISYRDKLKQVTEHRNFRLEQLIKNELDNLGIYIRTEYYRGEPIEEIYKKILKTEMDTTDEYSLASQLLREADEQWDYEPPDLIPWWQRESIKSLIPVFWLGGCAYLLYVWGLRLLSLFS